MRNDVEFNAIEHRNFNKILVTGNSNINFKEVCNVLYENNIEKPKNAKNYNISPEQIGEIILKEKVEKNGEVKVSRIWDSLVFDFFLANLDNGIWAWCDKNSLDILDYWKKIDDRLFFVLVYESPLEVVKKALLEKKDSEIEKLLLNWENEVDKILRFYYKNKHRCMLVNASNVLVNKRKYLENISNKVNLKIEVYESDSKSKLDKEELELDSLIYKFLEDKIDILDKFEEVQTFADISYVTDRNQNIDYLKFAKNLISITDKLSRIEQEKREIEKVKEDIATEKELLLSQLMTTQEELEKFYLENKRLKEEQEKKRYYGAADRIKSQLSYRLGAKMIEISKDKPLLLPFLPIILLKVRKEYKEYMKNRPKLPPIHTYADYYEAERIKNHLSYMLGETTIKTLKNNPFGIFILPLKLRKTYKNFKQQRDK